MSFMRFIKTQTNFAPHAPQGIVGQWGGAGGAVCENHISLALRPTVFVVERRAVDKLACGFQSVDAKTGFMLSDMGVGRADLARDHLLDLD